MDCTAVDIMAKLVDLVDGLVFDDLGSERAAPLHALIVLPGQGMEAFEARHDRAEAVLEELVAVNGEDSHAPELVALLSSLASLELWIGRVGVERPVWLLGVAEDGGRVGVRSTVTWT
jgi:hypothetical protein